MRRSGRPSTRLWWPSAATLACAGAIAAAPAAVAQPACPDVHVVFARGTGEPPGIGRVGQAFVDTLRGQIGNRTLTTYGVNYPASYDFAMAFDGANDASAYIVNYVQSCPTTRIVLGGYSQGAAVVDMLMGIPPLGNRIGNMGAHPSRRPVPECGGDRGIRQSRDEVRQPRDVGTALVRGQVHRPVQGRRPDLLRWPEPVRPQRLRERWPHESGRELRSRIGLAQLGSYAAVCSFIVFAA